MQDGDKRTVTRWTLQNLSKDPQPRGRSPKEISADQPLVDRFVDYIEIPSKYLINTTGIGGHSLRHSSIDPKM